MFRYLSVLLLAAVLGGCAGHATKASRQLQPDALGGVAILPFEGPHGNLFADRVDYELLHAGASVISKSKVAEALDKLHLQDARFGTATSIPRARKLGKLLGADTVVIGSVTAVPHGKTVLDRMRGTMGFKVATARLQCLRVADGTTVTRASYRSGYRSAWLADTYQQAAHVLVDAIFH